MLRKIIVALYAITMTVFSTFLVPVKRYGLLKDSFIHINNEFRSIFIQWKEVTEKSMFRYDFDFPRFIFIWISVSVVFASLFYISGRSTNNIKDDKEKSRN